MDVSNGFSELKNEAYAGEDGAAIDVGQGGGLVLPRLIWVDDGIPVPIAHDVNEVGSSHFIGQGILQIKVEVDVDLFEEPLFVNSDIEAVKFAQALGVEQTVIGNSTTENVPVVNRSGLF